MAGLVVEMHLNYSMTFQVPLRQFEMVRNFLKTRFENAGRKNGFPVCVHYPHPGECATALDVVSCLFLFFFGRKIILLHDVIPIYL